MTDSQQLLAEYIRTGSETAFRELVARYLDLVYSTALRAVDGDTHRAQDVAQTVFVDLGRQARTLGSDVMLGGWLHRHTRFVAATVLRGERRRQSRERQAVEMNALRDEPEANLNLVLPILDDAINQLGDTDRAAILLRFFEQRDFRSVGKALGSSEAAARMRVTRALEKLESLLKHRGITTSSAALVVLLGTHAIQAAPVGLVATISTAAFLSGTTVAASASATTIKTIVMTTLQKTIIGATLAAAVGTGLYEMRQASTLRSQVQTLQLQQSQANEQIQTLRDKRDSTTLAALQKENEQLRRTASEMPRLRGDLARLRAMEQQLAQLKPAAEQVSDPFTKSVLTFASRAAELNRQMDVRPQLRIPELSFLSESDWIEAGKMAKLGSETEVRQSLAMLRNRAKWVSYSHWQTALKAYLSANNGQLPTDPLQLKPYFDIEIDDALLQRYKMLHTGNIADNQNERWLIEEKAPVDDTYDTHMRMGIDNLDNTPIAGNQ